MGFLDIFGKQAPENVSATPDDTVKPKEKPCEPIRKIRTVVSDIKAGNGAAFSFEKTAVIIELVRAEDTEFVHIIDYDCYAGANGRPQYSLFEYYYHAECVDLSDISASNYKQKLRGDAVYQRREYDWGVRY